MFKCGQNSCSFTNIVEGRLHSDLITIGKSSKCAFKMLESVCRRWWGLKKGNRYHMIWLKHKWMIKYSLAKTSTKSFLMKNEYISRIPNEDSRRLNHYHRLQDQIASKKRQCSVFGGNKSVLFITNSNLEKRLMLLATDNKRSIRIVHKTSGVDPKTWKSDLLYGNAPAHAGHKNCRGNFKRIKLGCATPPTVFARHCSLGLSLVPIDCARIGWAVLG